jgi:hypothetical protein
MTKRELEDSAASLLGALMAINSDKPNVVAQMALAINAETIAYLDGLTNKGRSQLHELMKSKGI